MKSHKSLTIIVICLTILSSCKKDDTSPSVILPSPSERVLVSCEGNWGDSNASVSTYNTETKEVNSNVFESINGYNPGDVLQSMTEHAGQLYFVVNGSASIEVAGQESLIAESPINGAISPRKLLPVSGDKGYVSNIYTDDVQVIDFSSKVVTGAIDIGGWSEGMALVNQEVFVSRNNGSKLMVVNITTDAVIDSVEVGVGPIDIVKDVNGDLWVIGFGFDASFNVVDAHLTHVDPETRTVLGTFAIPQPWSDRMALSINHLGNRILILNNDVYEMGITDNTITPEVLVDNEHSNYGLGVDPSNGDVYVGYAPDFSSAGTVFRYTSNGTAIDEFEVGIAPNGFHFGE